MRSITDEFTSKWTLAFENMPYLRLWEAKEVWMYRNSLLVKDYRFDNRQFCDCGHISKTQLIDNGFYQLLR